MPASLFAAASAQGDPVAGLVLSLALILLVAKIGGDLAARIGQPAVLGELFGGILLGNVPLFGPAVLERLKHDPTLDVLGKIGALILLFEVGLESTVAQMLRVGLSSLLVATVGVIGPFFLGFAVALWLLPGSSAYEHAFLATVLCATSVGITARVFKDLGRVQTAEARIVLGAAVIDDVLGLLVLAVVAAVASAADRGNELSGAAIAFSVGKAIAFVIGAIAAGVLLSRHLFLVAARLRARGVLIAVGLSFCFVLSWLADEVGLAPIVGAFAAGLVLEDVHSTAFTGRGERALDQLIEPISQFLVPIFFVLMGVRTDLRALSQIHILGLAAALTLAAIVGKQICGLAVLERGVDRVFVGLGMIPRGEVGLVVASIGQGMTVRGEPMVDTATFSAAVIMVMVTTLITPPLLKWRSARTGRGDAAGYCAR
ncbi:MAG TPA: cation:proton antiporter [Myxococcales bacterium]|jgi:Kef-type K+ transport system membrane component KefB|nr:cation:proton antiporter [Myxococcales bacterium]